MGGMKDLFGDQLYEQRKPQQIVDPGEIGSFRRDGPQTMKSGAEAIAPKLGSLRWKVLQLFRVCGPMTDSELVDAYTGAYGKCEYRSISTRRRELVDRGFIIDTGRTSLNPKSGVQNIIWSAVDRPT